MLATGSQLTENETAPFLLSNITGVSDSILNADEVFPIMDASVSFYYGIKI